MSSACIIKDEKERDIPIQISFPKFSLDVALSVQKGSLRIDKWYCRTMLSFKKYPMPEDSRKSAEQVVAKYPSLITPGNNPYVSLFLKICLSIYQRVYV